MLSASFRWMLLASAPILLSGAVINIFAVAPAHLFSTCHLKFSPADCAHSIRVGSLAKTRLVMSATIRLSCVQGATHFSNRHLLCLLTIRHGADSSFHWLLLWSACVNMDENNLAN